jgi:hypothetical protein
MNPDPIIARRLLLDGIVRPVFLDEAGEQYVIDLRQTAQAAAKATQAHEWTDGERKARRRRAKRLKLIQHARDGFKEKHGWTPAELALLGTAPDENVAARIGRPVNAVRLRRMRFGIATVRDRRTS